MVEEELSSKGLKVSIWNDKGFKNKEVKVKWGRNAISPILINRIKEG